MGPGTIEFIVSDSICIDWDNIVSEWHVIAIYFRLYPLPDHIYLGQVRSGQVRADRIGCLRTL